jgi:hypothetical protein
MKCTSARRRRARLIELFEIIGRDAGTPAIGMTTSEEVILTTLPPLFCVSICLTDHCVT